MASCRSLHVRVPMPQKTVKTRSKGFCADRNLARAKRVKATHALIGFHSHDNDGCNATTAIHSVIFSLFLSKKVLTKNNQRPWPVNICLRYEKFTRHVIGDMWLGPITGLQSHVSDVFENAAIFLERPTHYGKTFAFPTKFETRWLSRFP